MRKFLFTAAVAALFPALAGAQDFSAFDRRLSDLEKRVAALESRDAPTVLSTKPTTLTLAPTRVPASQEWQDLFVQLQRDHRLSPDYLQYMTTAQLSDLYPQYHGGRDPGVVLGTGGPVAGDAAPIQYQTVTRQVCVNGVCQLVTEQVPVAAPPVSGTVVAGSYYSESSTTGGSVGASGERRGPLRRLRDAWQARPRLFGGGCSSGNCQ